MTSLMAKRFELCQKVAAYFSSQLKHLEKIAEASRDWSLCDYRPTAP